MYTQNLGVDLGGTWGNSDTTLSSINISGGTLMPAFRSDIKTYGLITGASSNLKITPTAANRNYLTKTFLNSYNNNAAHYKRTEMIRVQADDTVYIGVGERSWPSMNKQGTESRIYAGTKYTIKMYETLADYAQDYVTNLPGNTAMTLGNYLSYKEQVDYARELYDNSGITMDASRLIEAEARLTFFTQITSLKELLKKIPQASRIKVSDKNKVLQVDTAYKNLSEDQKLYIVTGDVKNYNACLVRLKELGAFTIYVPNKIKGNDKEPEPKPIEEVVLIPTIVIPSLFSNGQVEGTITESLVKKIIEDMAKLKTKKVVFELKLDKNVEKSNVKIEQKSIEELIKAEADLIIKSAVGEVELPTKVLEAISKTSGLKEIDINVGKIVTKSLSATQIKAVGNEDVYDIEIMNGDKKISTFGGNKLTITLPYTLKEDETGEKVFIWYMNDEGILERIGCTFDENTGMATFATDHLSYYLVGYDDKINFKDLKKSDWYYKSAMSAVQKNLFQGTSETEFSPNQMMTRSMFVTVLHRLDGKTKCSHICKFTDVDEKSWYTDAINWSAEKSIVSGINKIEFMPDGEITREQVATVLYRYALSQGKDMEVTGVATSFEDNDEISGWAKDAVKWSVGKGLLSGNDNGVLDPKGKATRAEVATIFQRYCDM